MLSSQARVVTDQPQRYIKQLVSHLAHRLSTELAANGDGVIQVDRGRCILTAQTGVLVLAAVADDRAELLRIQDVVGRHLERFGARAGLRVTWSPVTTSSGAVKMPPPADS